MPEITITDMHVIVIWWFSRESSVPSGQNNICVCTIQVINTQERQKIGVTAVSKFLCRSIHAVKAKESQDGERKTHTAESKARVGGVWCRWESNHAIKVWEAILNIKLQGYITGGLTELLFPWLCHSTVGTITLKPQGWRGSFFFSLSPYPHALQQQSTNWMGRKQVKLKRRLTLRVHFRYLDMFVLQSHFSGKEEEESE